MRTIDLSGNKFGRWTALERLSPITSVSVHWICVCDCGQTGIVSRGNLRNGTSRSCGCLQKELISMRNRRHGLAGTKEYIAWRGMKRRCYVKKQECFKNYGGRGIIVCERWKNSFMRFLSDMGKAPSKAHSIDRINNDGNYEPGNCRWATALQQTRNRRKK